MTVAGEEGGATPEGDSSMSRQTFGRGLQATRRDDWGGTGMTDELWNFIMGFLLAGLISLVGVMVLA